MNYIRKLFLSRDSHLNSKMIVLSKDVGGKIGHLKEAASGTRLFSFHPCNMRPTLNQMLITFVSTRPRLENKNEIHIHTSITHLSEERQTTKTMQKRFLFSRLEPAFPRPSQFVPPAPALPPSPLVL